MPNVKDKERLLKAAIEKETVIYRGVSIRLSADFLKETLQGRRYLQEIFKVIKSRDLQPRLLYPANLSFRIKGQIKSFPDKTKLKEFIITKPLLYEILKGLILKKKIRTINNEMAKNTYLSTIESEKQTRQRRRTETESWIWRAVR